MSYICGMFQTSFTIRRGDSRGIQLSSSIFSLRSEFSMVVNCSVYNCVHEISCFKVREEKYLHHAHFAAKCDTFVRDSVVIFSCWI